MSTIYHLMIRTTFFLSNVKIMRSVLAEPSLLKGADNTDREQLEKWTKSLLDEFLNIGNFEEALQEITEKFSNNTISTFLENVFEKVI